MRNTQTKSAPRLQWIPTLECILSEILALCCLNREEEHAEGTRLSKDPQASGEILPVEVNQEVWSGGFH